jgi:hypothetical protein
LGDRTFGFVSTVDAGSYHHVAKGLLAYPLPQIPAGVVRKAELVAPHVTNTSGTWGTFNLQVVTSGDSTSWDESTVSWNNAPAASGEFPPRAMSVANGENRYDVTDQVQAELSRRQPEITFLLTPNQGNTFVDSKENARGGTYLHMETYVNRP